MKVSVAWAALLLWASIIGGVVSHTPEHHHRHHEMRTKHFSKFICGLTCDESCKEYGLILNDDDSYSIAYACLSKDLLSEYNPVWVLLVMCLVVAVLFFLLIIFVICVSLIITFIYNKCVGAWRKCRPVPKKEESAEEVSLNVVVEIKDDDGIGRGTAV